MNYTVLYIIFIAIIAIYIWLFSDPHVIEGILKFLKISTK